MAVSSVISGMTGALGVRIEQIRARIPRPSGRGPALAFALKVLGLYKAIGYTSPNV
jgi:hypothetical protein